MTANWYPSQNPSERVFVIYAVFTLWFHFVDVVTKTPRCLNNFLGIVCCHIHLALYFQKLLIVLSALYYSNQVVQIEIFSIGIWQQSKILVITIKARDLALYYFSMN